MVELLGFTKIFPLFIASSAIASNLSVSAPTSRREEGIFKESFISAAAYSLWGILLKYNPVSKIAIFGFLNPVCGVVLSAFLLGETQQAFGIRSVLALGFVAAGIIVVYAKKEGA